MSHLPFFQRTHPARPTLSSGPSRPGSRAGRDRPQVVNSVEHQAALAYRLTDRDRWLARMLFEHQVLHAGQISAAAFASPNSARERLRELHHWSVLDRFRPQILDGSSAQHYVLGPAGATVLASEEGLDPKTLGYRRDRAMRIAHSIRLAHTVERNGWFLALLARAVWGHDQPGMALLAWWSEQRCARLFGDLVRPDGYGRWYEPGHGGIEFFLEYDRGTENTHQVARKLDGYAQLAAATGIATPVLVWLPTPAREAHVRSSLARAWRGLPDPHRVPVATAAATGLDPDEATASPADPLWLPLAATPAARGQTRVGLSHLRTAWPHLPERTPTAESISSGSGAHRGMLPAPDPMPPPAQRPTRSRWDSTRG